MQEAFLPWQSLPSNSGYQIATGCFASLAMTILGRGTTWAGAESRPYNKC